MLIYLMEETTEICDDIKMYKALRKQADQLYYKVHKEHIIERVKQYKKAHPEVARRSNAAYYQRRKARLLAARETEQNLNPSTALL